VRAVVASLLVAAALAGCGATGPRESASPSFLGRGCAIELAMERDASEAEIAAFGERLRSTAHVKRVDTVPRERFIMLFERALRRDGYRGDRYKRLVERSRKYAGTTLIAVPDDTMHVPQILVALNELPAAVASVFDRPSCAHGSR
jgi:hypothetical protein